jgi:hypothetical protein
LRFLLRLRLLTLEAPPPAVNSTPADPPPAAPASVAAAPPASSNRNELPVETIDARLSTPEMEFPPFMSKPPR